MTMTDADERANIREFLPPFTILLISVPLVFEMIPRNALYGIRVREAMASDESWYAINQLGGLGSIAACLVWLPAAAYAPRHFVKPIGIGTLVMTLAILVLTQGWSL